MVRVNFDLEVELGYPPVSSEIIHGSVISDNLIVIENTPFFVEGIALGDVVLCEDLKDGEIWNFLQLREESGNRAISIIFIDNSCEDIIYKKIKSMGHYCEYGAFPEYTMLAVCVSKDSPITNLTEYLFSLEQDGKISYAELCL